MTKVTIIGEATLIQKKKPIQFARVIHSNSLEIAVIKPHEWDNIELICKNYGCGYDLMFAYNHERDQGVAYLGYFNDGVVE